MTSNSKNHYKSTRFAFEICYNVAYSMVGIAKWRIRPPPIARLACISTLIGQAAKRTHNQRPVQNIIRLTRLHIFSFWKEIKLKNNFRKWWNEWVEGKQFCHLSIVAGTVYLTPAVVIDGDKTPLCPSHFFCVHFPSKVPWFSLRNVQKK